MSSDMPCHELERVKPGYKPLLQISDTIEQSTILTNLQQFFILITRQNLPFEEIETRNPMTRGWFEAALCDEVACFALLTHWAKDQSRITGHRKMRVLGLYYESKTTSLIRKRLALGSTLTEEVLLAAAFHYMSAAFEVVNCSQLDMMIRGIEALLNHFGGISKIAANMRFSTVFSVQHTDIFNALANVRRPLFTEVRKPAWPESLSSMYRVRSEDLDIYQFEDDTVDAINSVTVLLFFRIPSQQTRALLDEEQTYLRLLEYWLNYQLSILQYKYSGTTSLDNLVILAVIITKLEIVAEECSHAVLILAILRRLQMAIHSCSAVFGSQHPASTHYELLSIWASIVALTQRSLSHKRTYFLSYLEAALLHRYGETPAQWSSCMEEELRNELRRLPWHDRIDACFTSLCASLRESAT